MGKLLSVYFYIIVFVCLLASARSSTSTKHEIYGELLNVNIVSEYSLNLRRGDFKPTSRTQVNLTFERGEFAFSCPKSTDQNPDTILSSVKYNLPSMDMNEFVVGEDRYRLFFTKFKD